MPKRPSNAAYKRQRRAEMKELGFVEVTMFVPVEAKDRLQEQMKTKWQDALYRHRTRQKRAQSGYGASGRGGVAQNPNRDSKALPRSSTDHHASSRQVKSKTAPSIPTKGAGRIGVTEREVKDAVSELRLERTVTKEPFVSLLMPTARAALSTPFDPDQPGRSAPRSVSLTRVAFEFDLELIKVLWGFMCHQDRVDVLTSAYGAEIVQAAQHRIGGAAKPELPAQRPLEETEQARPIAHGWLDEPDERDTPDMDKLLAEANPFLPRRRF